MSDQNWLKNGIRVAKVNLDRFPENFRQKEEIVQVVENSRSKNSSQSNSNCESTKSG